ncbi:hypothetical protein NDI47_18700 [Microcoleus vaginatus GB1-A2]|uniref:hypothetical protein n=1 Tax=Microcoleus vaginatus TaxID=119532 RepID=UPI001687CB21|nr:hypothetical protein [Microcoleus sp. FACHB-61]
MTCALELARFVQVLYILIDSPELLAIEMSARAKLSRSRLQARCGRESPNLRPIPKPKYSKPGQKADRPFG